MIPFVDSTVELMIAAHPPAQPTSDNTGKCASCVLGRFCVSCGLSEEELRQLDAIVDERLRLKKGQQLFAMSAPLEAIYAVRFGMLKSHVTLADGREQITAFHLPGEIVGLDAIGTQQHLSDATALEDSEVCVMRYAELETLAQSIPALQRQISRLLSQTIAHDQQLLLALGSMRAEERLATFLLDLSHRLNQRGYSPTEFVLRMSREEIGSYLGLKLETVSRLFSRFAEAGLLQVKQRHVQFIDLDGLRLLLNGGA